METMRRKADLIKAIKKSQSPAELHHVLVDSPSVAKLAERKFGLAYDKKTDSYLSLKDLGDLVMSVPYDTHCLKYDLATLVRIE